MTNMRKEYKLDVKIGIQEYDVSYVDHTGSPVDIEDVKTAEDGTLYAVGVDGKHYPVRKHEQWSNSNGRLSVEESRNLGAMGFMQLMGVMGEMHKAIEKIQ